MCREQIAFIRGRPPSGQGVYELCRPVHSSPVTLELGGKSANIVFKDAAIDNAVKGVVSGHFRSHRQTCNSRARAR